MYGKYFLNRVIFINYFMYNYLFLSFFIGDIYLLYVGLVRKYLFVIFI